MFTDAMDAINDLGEMAGCANISYIGAFGIGSVVGGFIPIST